MKVAAIVNPVSGRKKARTQWPILLRSFGQGAPAVDTFWTGYPGHAEELAASARCRGYDRVIAVGGDGTLFEVLNGLWREDRGDMPQVGVVPFGTGCDYIRNFDVGLTRSDKLRTALGESAIPVSLGRCKYRSDEGRREKVFAMVAGVGFDAEVIRRFRSRAFVRSDWAAYALSAIAEIKTLKSHIIRGTIDSLAFETEAFFFGAALGCCFGKRIIIAPGASPSHYKFELIWAKPVRYPALLRLIFLAYAGRLGNHPLIGTASARKITINARPHARVEADGELLGSTPIEIEVIPEAFSFAARGFKSLLASS